MSRPAKNISFTLCLTLLTFELAATAPAQTNFQTLLVGVDHRTTVSLNGDWHYLVDQSPARALYTGTGAINNKSYAMNTRPNFSTGPHNEEYDFSTAPTLRVPGDWNTQVPQLFNYEGIDWMNYGGLTRDVSLVTVPTHFIDDYDVHLAHGATWQPGTTELTGYVHVLDAPAGTAVTLDIPEAGVHTTATTDAEGRAPFDVKAASLTLWSPESPRLYKVTLASGSGDQQDKLTDDVGFRDIRVDGTRILLNGKAVFLRGANMHAEAPVRGGRANTDQDVATIFSYLKDLNANFVRLAHYPHDERMERTADRDGVMIWSEIPLWQHTSSDKSA